MDGTPDRDAAALFYAALALREGHPVDDVAEMLGREIPCQTPAAIVGEAGVRQAEILTLERVTAYIAVHPFAWELRLNACEIVGVQVVQGMQ